MEKRIKIKKKPAAYQVKRSAVKNIHLANSGIARIRQVSPTKMKSFGFRKARSIPVRIKKRISCTFIHVIEFQIHQYEKKNPTYEAKKFQQAGLMCHGIGPHYISDQPKIIHVGSRKEQ